MYKIAVIVMVIFFSNVSTNSQTYSPQAQALYELFSGENCEFNCILGIQPEITTHQEFTAWLESQQLAYESPTHAPEEIYWFTPSSIFLPYNRLLAIIQNGHIREISGAIDIPVDVIVEVFGAPPSMTFDLSETQNADQALITYMLYPEYGLGFKLGRASFPDVHTTSFVLTAPENPYGWVASPLGEPMTDSCTNYDVWPCIAPTATPTTIPLPTAVPPTQTPVPPTLTPTPVPPTLTPTPSFKAEAGPNQTVKIPHDGLIGGEPLYASVMLNGAGSIGALTYAWSRNGQPVSGQAVTTLQLIPGSYLFTLTITGAGGQTASDSVTITVTTCITGTAGYGNSE
jgi:hypothetical protein